MKAHISEVFSSIQGEGTLIGRRQIFVRFSGCNLKCNYCDTSKNQDPLYGEEISVDELFERVNEIITPDFHSISFTGGEPLLHADFIREFLEKHNFKALIETNGSLPKELAKIVDLIDYASVDIKLPEHEASSNWDDLFGCELESIKILRDEGINTYSKVVVMPSTKVDLVGYIASRIAREVPDTSNLSMVIQPVSPLGLWADEERKLFRISEKAGEYLDVLVIPQVHKLLKVR
ncbi:MAG: 7-carboxy-7-deazaguanine synthase QueE [Methanobacterium paludis]|jgi:7-carboxy-7-deazaguanine synthase|uniref:7-carboxy-7-deazaguanine synthase n=1 Tax=Methanobacterium paludis (strain DSM 25820 / JCM 18151 / SWAN1) TaxID=868131 RepID=F6D3G8_METPW|nr:7-carboxy-7-deazaguanine synthase QueE [Methanobacterium paludis]AEG19144.1 Radical SAM domain protein [Methanobacterium paludis]MCE7697552.1 7-carboxy-7-deazaguanine synthase QueE [Methanobacterium paludis]